MEKSGNAADMRIAIVGMAIRCPGAENVDQYWSNLRSSREIHYDILRRGAA